MAAGTIPANGTINFGGEGEVRVVSPKFAGSCSFVFGKAAETRMPDTAARLRGVFERSCAVYRETKDGRVKPSTATTGPTAPISHSANDYGSLCNGALKTKALELVAQLRNFVTANRAIDDQESDEDWAAESTFPLTRKRTSYTSSTNSCRKIGTTSSCRITSQCSCHGRTH